MLSLEDVAEVVYQAIKRENCNSIALSFLEKIKFENIIKNNNFIYYV